MPCPVLEPTAARLGASRPGRKLRHDAILLAGDEAGLLQEWLGLKVLTNDVLCRNVFLLLDARYLSHLNAFLPLNALQGFLQAFRNHRLALIPRAQPPVIQLFVPVTNFEAVLLVTGSLGLLTVGVQRCPPFHMSTPHSPGLNASWTTFVSHASAPRT